MSIRDMLFDRRNAFITRWHARQTQREESLAEHNGFMARDAELIARALHYYGIAKPNILDVMSMALVHDEAEKLLGDVSGEAKRIYPKLKETLCEIEQGIIDTVLFDGLPTPLGDYYRNLAKRITEPLEDDLEAQIVKYADKLEAYLFAYIDVKLGNSLMAEVETRIMQEFEGLTWPWLRELRRETGLP